MGIGKGRPYNKPKKKTVAVEDDPPAYEELTLDDAMAEIETRVNRITAKAENVLIAFKGDGTTPEDRNQGRKAGIDCTILRTLHTLDDLIETVIELENRVCRVE